MFVFFLLASLVSATELKLTKVSDLQVGDVVVSKAGVEIPIENIIAVESDKITISEYLRQKVFGDRAQEEIKISTEKTVASGNSGFGVISGNAVISLPMEEKSKISFLERIRIKVRGWFGK